MRHSKDGSEKDTRRREGYHAWMHKKGAPYIDAKAVGPSCGSTRKGPQMGTSHGSQRNGPQPWKPKKWVPVMAAQEMGPTHASPRNGSEL